MINVTVTIENEHLLYLYHTDLEVRRVMYFVGDDQRYLNSYDPQCLIIAFANIGIDAWIMPHNLLKQAI